MCILIFHNIQHYNPTYYFPNDQFQIQYTRFLQNHKTITTKKKLIYANDTENTHNTESNACFSPSAYFPKCQVETSIRPHANVSFRGLCGSRILDHRQIPFILTAGPLFRPTFPLWGAFFISCLAFRIKFGICAQIGLRICRGAAMVRVWCCTVSGWLIVFNFVRYCSGSINLFFWRFFEFSLEIDDLFENRRVFVLENFLRNWSNFHFDMILITYETFRYVHVEINLRFRFFSSVTIRGNLCAYPPYTNLGVIF